MDIFSDQIKFATENRLAFMIIESMEDIKIQHIRKELDHQYICNNNPIFDGPQKFNITIDSREIVLYFDSVIGKNYNDVISGTGFSCYHF